ncbi:MAG TPA: response regulator, partial [Vicinamibacterales bacterium]|nr:response regulator [Vicinamibacterales bacterium]
MGDVDAVVAQIRYELRNPINTILGYSQLLLEEGDSSPLSVAERHDLEGVADAGKQLLQTIGAMLDPAAVTDGIEEYAFRLRYATRVPLTTIRGCIKTLLEGHQNAPIGDDLRRIGVAAVRFFKLIDGIEHTFVAAKGDAPPSVSVTAADIEATVHVAGGGSILIIDDEEANRALLSRRLIRQGYSVLVAATGEAGLAIAARESVDVILLDVWLPGTSGYEILARLKSNEASREIPVLVITAVDRPESVARCLALG